jgi:hypothetical protein
MLNNGSRKISLIELMWCGFTMNQHDFLSRLFCREPKALLRESEALGSGKGCLWHSSPNTPSVSALLSHQATRLNPAGRPQFLQAVKQVPGLT